MCLLRLLVVVVLLAFLVDLAQLLLVDFESHRFFLLDLFLVLDCAVQAGQVLLQLVDLLARVEAHQLLKLRHPLLLGLGDILHIIESLTLDVSLFVTVLNLKVVFIIFVHEILRRVFPLHVFQVQIDLLFSYTYFFAVHTRF